MNTFKDLEQKAKLVRKLCLEITSAAGSGHPTSCLSAADVMTVLFDKHFAYDLDNPLNVTNDRFILSKGHAAPLFYTLYAMSGAISIDELKTLRQFTSNIEGHPTMHFKYTDAATGSLGQGLSVGAGLAYLQHKQASEKKARTYVLLGDGELAEGQIWEAGNFASYYQLDNLVAIADINRLAQSQETMFEHHMDQYERRFKAFGFETVVIDGHNFEEISLAFDSAVANTTGKPFAIIAKTFKGRGISFLENKDNWHGKALKKEDLEKALEELGDVDDSLRFTLKTPAQAADEDTKDSKPTYTVDVDYKKGDEIGTRDVYGKILGQLGDSNSAIMSLDGDVKNSTYAMDFKTAHPDRFVECFIAEQNMVSVAVGLARLGKVPFVSTFAAFFSRAADQIRMAALSQANVRFVGSHAGISIGEDGTSQMGLEDIAMFGTIPHSVIFHPTDAVATAKVLPLMAEHVGISYLRTLRPKTKVIYDTTEEFTIGGSKVLQKSDKDVLTVVAMGITVPEALSAYQKLQKDGISIRVIDCYCVKPIDKETLLKSTQATEQKIIITVEDHYEHGGLGDFVLSALADEDVKVYKLAVKEVSHSGKMAELLHTAKIDADAIVEKVKDLTSSTK